MRIDELVKLNDVMKSNQYLKLLQGLKAHTSDSINLVKLKNQVMKSWSIGLKSRSHYDNLLKPLNINLNDLID